MAEQRHDIDPYWHWVASRRAHDNPRGDFIRDTRDLLHAGGNPHVRIVSACTEARREHELMIRQYKRATGRTYGY